MCQPFRASLHSVQSLENDWIGSLRATGEVVDVTTMGGHSSKRSSLGRSAPHADGLANANDIALQSEAVSLSSDTPLHN